MEAEAEGSDAGPESAVVFTGDFFSVSSSDGRGYSGRSQFFADSCNESSSPSVFVSSLLRSSSSLTRQSFQKTGRSPVTTTTTTRTKEKKAGRCCSLHEDELIRFFCTDCLAVICRDCMLTTHALHAAADLSTKGCAARELVLRVTDASQRHLEAKLRQTLAEAEKQRQRVQRQRTILVATLRAEDLKRENDASLAEAQQELCQETDDVVDIISLCIDNMSRELACFLSLTEHARREAESGCDVAALGAVDELKQFYGDVGEDEFDFILGDSSSGVTDRASAGAAAVTPHCFGCRLKAFRSSEWRVGVELGDVNTLKQCRRCFRQHDKDMDFCPTCCAPAEAEETHPPPPPPFHPRSWGSSCRPQPG